MYAGAGDDVVYGEEGNDTLNGEEGNDILVGGSGNDRLNGEYGIDTYYLNLGDGQDVIFDYEYGGGARADKIVFGEGISAEDLVLGRRNNDLVMKYSEEDQVTIQNAYGYSQGYAEVENLEFADETKAYVDYANQAVVVTYRKPVEEPIIEELPEEILPDENAAEDGMTEPVAAEPVESEVIETVAESDASEAIENTAEPVVMKSEDGIVESAASEENLVEAAEAATAASDEQLEASVQILMTYLNEEETVLNEEESDTQSEESAAEFFETEEAGIVTMTNLLVQEMNEAAVTGASEADLIVQNDAAASAPQLWVE